MYTQYIYRPLFNLIIFLQNVVPSHDLGIVIIFLAFLVRLVFYPLTKKSLRVQKTLNQLQPEIKKIQEQYKNNKEEQGRKVMELYKGHKVNPMSGCLPVLIQLPIMIALYQILRQNLGDQAFHLYSFVGMAGETNYLFLGLINLAVPNIMLSFLAGISQFFSTKLTMPKAEKSKEKKEKFNFQTQMMYLSPFLTFFISLKLSSGLALFWASTNIFMVLQQVLADHYSKKSPESKKL